MPRLLSNAALRNPAAKLSVLCISRSQIRILRRIYSAPRIRIRSRFTFGCPAGHSLRPSARLSPSGACPLQQPRFLGQGELTYDEALKSMGDAGLGIITVAFYDRSHDSAANRAFGAAFKDSYGRNPGPLAVGGFDGMHLIFETLKKTGGNADGEPLISAAKGTAWESPRGPVSIDPETRDIVQTVYI